MKAVERALGAYLISTDRARLDLEAIYSYLARESYWARGRSRERIARGIDNSLPFGLYKGDAQVGFARVVTDYATFAWLADVYVVERERGRGLGKALIEAVVDHETVRDLPRVLLATADAHGLYERYGFRPLHRGERFMAIESSAAADAGADGTGPTVPPPG